MQLADILGPEAVKIFPSVSSKKRLFQELGDLMEQTHGLNSGLVLDALQERETLGPTGVGNGIALPHARLDGLDKVVGAFIRVEKPLEFSAVDRQPVDLIFALFAPEDAGVDHLKALALVSRMMRVSGKVSMLRSNTDIQTLYTILTERQSSHAA
ncbi:MAG: PTS sugar transporter subunit IIA [Alphaproteobacteria bacterium]|nr:PTS sugar transporter subunit IIA [Alphaproteobacteria bacterium]NNF24271.1 PTS transporter subunit EIIA [Paracoccaceae bacterium]